MSAPRRLSWGMHAFPRRFRAERSAEIEATFHEAELAGDHHPYGARALVDVVLAGWRERARTRPPLGAYLKYRLLAGRLEPRWHPWMLDELAGWFRLRRAFTLGVLMMAIFVPMAIVRGQPVPGGMFWWLLAWATSAYAGGGLDRRRRLRQHGYDPATRLWAPPVVVHWVPTPHRIRRAAPWLTGTGIALMIVTPFAATPLLFPDIAVSSITKGAFSSERVVDHTVAVGVGALVAGLLALVVGLVTRRWIALRTLAPADELDPEAFVVVPAGRAVWFVPPTLVVVGVCASLLPVAPLAVPAAFLAAGIASPMLLVLALTARRMERNGHGAVGMSTAPHAAVMAATQH